MKNKEPKLTINCSQCEHPYGKWRPRCPACGHTTPASVREEALRAPATAKPKKKREPRPDDCIFCQRKKAKESCEHCGERVHRVCKQLHTPRCIEFQQQLAQAMDTKQLGKALREALTK